jgi:hypothetical protein
MDPNPSLGSLILWLHGFGVVNILGIDLRETLIGDLGVLSRFEEKGEIPKVGDI